MDLIDIEPCSQAPIMAGDTDARADSERVPAQQSENKLTKPTSTGVGRGTESSAPTHSPTGTGKTRRETNPSHFEECISSDERNTGMEKPRGEETLVRRKVGSSSTGPRTSEGAVSPGKEASDDRSRVCVHGQSLVDHGAGNGVHFKDGHCSDPESWTDEDGNDSDCRKARNRRVAHYSDQKRIREGHGLYGWRDDKIEAEKAKYLAEKKDLEHKEGQREEVGKQWCRTEPAQ